MSSALSACDKTVGECSNVSKLLGPRANALQEAQASVYKSRPEHSAELANQHATTTAGQVAAVEKLNFTNARLGRHIADYAATAKETAHAARDLGAAYQTLVGPRQELLATEQTWSQSGEALNGACSTESSSCTAIKELPLPGTGDDPLADELDKYAAKLETIVVDDDELKQPIAVRGAAARAFAQAHRKLSAAEATVDGVSGRFYQALSKSDTAYESIRSDCNGAR